MTLGSDFHGPATMILHYQIMDLIVAANDLTFSTYETTIQLPALPSADAFHPTKPTVVLTGKLKSTTLHLAGKAGIPKTGVAGVVIRLDSTGEGGSQECGQLRQRQRHPPRSFRARQSRSPKSIRERSARP